MNAERQLQSGPVEGLLIDLDGVLYVGSKAVEGAREAADGIREMRIPMRFITNTTTQPLSALAEKLERLGFAIPEAEILTAPVAARQFLRRKRDVVCKFLLNDAVLKDFQEFEVSDTKANAVVIGDIGDAWNYALLNSVFRLLMDGAELIALHRNKFWETEDGLTLDIGAFVAGLEYASGTNATVIGKPSRAFFDVAIADLGAPRDRVLMIGDDVDSDVGGARKNGIRGVLVKTGKFREEYFKASGVNPDAVIDSFADVGSLLGA